MIDDGAFNRLVEATMDEVVKNYEGTLSGHGFKAAEFVRQAMISGRKKMRPRRNARESAQTGQQPHR